MRNIKGNTIIIEFTRSPKDAHSSKALFRTTQVGPRHARLCGVSR